MRLFVTNGLLLAALLLAPTLAQAQATSQTISTGTVTTIVYDNGNIGGDCTGTHTGFQFLGDPGAYLCGGAFILGISPTQVIGEPYILDGAGGWEPGGISASTSFPYAAFDEGYEVSFSDNEGVGVDVTMNAYYTSDAALSDVVVLEYTITNTSGSALNGVYPGLFMDWDLGPGNNYATNEAGVDEGRNALWVRDPLAGTPHYYGQAALSDDLSGWAYFINYPVGGFHDNAEFFAALSTTGGQNPPQQDQRTVTGVGPFDIPAGGSITVTFAVTAGEDQDDFLANVDDAAAATSGPPAEPIHDTGVVQLEVYDNGEIGAYADAAGVSLGTGFVFDGVNGLYEATALVGVSPTQVSGDAYEFPDLEWETTAPLASAEPPIGYDQEFKASYDDSAASNPIGVEVTQRSFSRDGDPFVIVTLRTCNTTAAPLDDAYIGIFADWDAGDYLQNLGAYDEDTRLLYVWDNSDPASQYYGIAALHHPHQNITTTVSGTAYDVLPGDATMFAGLSTFASEPGTPADRRTVIGTGPYDIGAGDCRLGLFAFVGGEDEEDIIANAAAAQTLVQDMGPFGVANEPQTVVNGLRLDAPYPNPSHGVTTVAFSLAEAQAVRIVAYDALGRRVATLAEGAHAAGAHTVTWEAQGLPSGVYVIRLEAGETNLSRTIIVNR